MGAQQTRPRVLLAEVPAGRYVLVFHPMDPNGATCWRSGVIEHHVGAVTYLVGKSGGLPSDCLAEVIDEAPVAAMRDCTCLGSCKGATGLAPGWRCALAAPHPMAEERSGLSHCDECDWTFGCFRGDEPCRKRPLAPDPRDAEIAELRACLREALPHVDIDHLSAAAFDDEHPEVARLYEASNGIFGPFGDRAEALAARIRKAIGEGR